MKDWQVTVTLKNGQIGDYIFYGRKEEARQDAYLSFPLGSIRNVIVTEYNENEEY